MNGIMVALRFINLLSIVVWIGGMTFFSVFFPVKISPNPSLPKRGTLNLPL